MENAKKHLSEHVERIFKQYTSPGIHICDIATGGGKSYTIGKLTCEYYPQHFDKIIILCVQNKLVTGMDKEIERFISTPESKLKPKEKLVIENNPDVIKKAIKNGSFTALLDEMAFQLHDKQGMNTADLQYSYGRVKKIFEGLSGLINMNESVSNDYLSQQIEESEANLRKAVRAFFENFKKHLEKIEQKKNISQTTIYKLFPDLKLVYPQVEYDDKKVLLMTVHKAMYGIDPIIAEKVTINNFTKKGKRTLILFDESDQAAIAIRDVIIDQSINANFGSQRFAKGYNGFLQYRALLGSPENTSDSYYGSLLENCMDKAKSIIESNWMKELGETKPYNSIFLDTPEDIETFRRGVFFSGPIKLNISQSGDKNNSFICYKKGNRHLSLVHSAEKEQLQKENTVVIPLDAFLKLISRNITSIKSQFRSVITESLEKSKAKFIEEIGKRSINSTGERKYLGYPTLEREIHTFFSRFESASEYHLEQQQMEFMTNRKNVIQTKELKPIKLPDYSVYSQGVQFFQEEIDEKDNQHRVRLSSREIANTPEKILVNLTCFNNTTVVLCSATASNKSVVSNFDIIYLKEILGDKVHRLSVEDRNRFDELLAQTYPAGHRVEIVPIEHYEYADKRENHLELPQKYKEMFSKAAQEAGLAEEWFRITVRNLRKNESNIENTLFQLYRLFQFIESYYWFITHDDIHSMIFFQNRTGDKDRCQIHVLSCLIDGSFQEMPSQLDGELPSDWINNHIKISRDWDEVEKDILTELSQNKDSKLMLVSAYGSFKAGTNMQYAIPEDLDYISGDNWETEGETQKKDWDAVYLQSPTGYLMMAEDGYESTFEKSFYNAMLVLMMLYERGCLSKSDVARWLYQALTNTFYFSEKKDLGIAKDKAAWAQTIVEQAVGRLCRTRNKNRTTYLLYDETMTSYFDASNLDKSLTKEFRTLSDYILAHPDYSKSLSSAEEIKRCNDANYAQGLLDKMRSLALYYTPHSDDLDDEYYEEETNGDIPYRILVNQRMNQSYKRAIITKPVISGLEQLDEEDHYLTFINKCYGNWERDENGGYCFSYDNEKRRICPTGKGKKYRITPSDVRLDVLMKNGVIRKHFEAHGFATEWGQTGLILHPQILRSDYTGEIGEEAFLALVHHYTDCKPDEIKHLEGKDYELADFVLCNPDGSYRLAFDVKNMNPNADHNDKNGDLPTSEKRKKKEERLKCKLITVNILKIDDTLMDDINEIGGLIDERGNIVYQGLDTLKELIKAH